MLATLLAAVLAIAPFQNPPATIQGFVVRAETTEAIRGASVRLEAAGGASATVNTDDAGKFVFRDVPPGVYRISAVRDGYIRGHIIGAAGSAWQDAGFIRRYEDLGTPVRIGDGSRESVTLKIIRVRR